MVDGARPKANIKSWKGSTEMGGNLDGNVMRRVGGNKEDTEFGLKEERKRRPLLEMGEANHYYYYYYYCPSLSMFEKRKWEGKLRGIRRG